MNDQSKSDKSKEKGDAEDIVFEDDMDEAAGLGADAKEKIKKLKERLAACEKEKREYLNGWQKCQADFVNARKREEEAKKDFVKFASEKVIADIVPVLDSFEMAMADKEWEKADPGWRKGVESIRSQIVSALAANGLAAIEPKEGDEFNAAEHEAVSSAPAEDSAKEHTIAAVSQKGYKLNGRVLRPAKVVVYSEAGNK